MEGSSVWLRETRDSSRNPNTEGADAAEGGSQHLSMIEFYPKLGSGRGSEGQRPLLLPYKKKLRAP